MRLTKRGEIVLAISAFIVLGLVLKGGYELINHIWWVDGQGYCWGELSECIKGRL